MQVDAKPHALGVVGLDMGIEVHGKIWVTRVKSKTESKIAYTRYAAKLRLETVQDFIDTPSFYLTHRSPHFCTSSITG